MKLAILLASLFSLSASAALAQGRCHELWVERNQIYKDAGYCFRTPAAIRTFGNRGCIYDDINEVPLSNRQRAWVNEIVRLERRYGCR